MTRVLRAVALAIAFAAMVDPIVTIDRPARARVAVVLEDARSAEARRVSERLARDLGVTYEIVQAVTSDAAATIVIGDRYPEPSSLVVAGVSPISTVTLSSPNVAVAYVAAPRETLPSTSIRIEADVDAHDAVGQTTDVIARIDGIEVGRVSHRWTRAPERWTASLDVAPFGEPPFVVRVEAGSSAGDVMVARRATPIRVQASDPRPSWTSTFTRRALESDPRFQVESLVATARGTQARTAGAVPLGDSRIDDFDALLIGGADMMSAADARALDRYMRTRGGLVVLLPDSRTLSQGALDLFSGGRPSALTERLLERPATLITRRAAAALQASELLLPPPDRGADVLASAPGSDAAPVVVSMPRGAGRLIFSGAMDAWRFRADGDRGFDRFWQAVVAGAALAAPPRVDVAVVPSPLRPGDDAEVVVRARGASAVGRVSAAIDGRAIRVWPAAQEGVYRGAFVADVTERRSAVRAIVSDGLDTTASAIVPVRRDIEHARDTTLAPLAMLAASRGGMNVDARHLADLVRFVRNAAKPARAPVRAHPMRSSWWIAPFAGCLGAEWWLRRRRGLR